MVLFEGSVVVPLGMGWIESKTFSCKSFYVVSICGPCDCITIKMKHIFLNVVTLTTYESDLCSIFCVPLGQILVHQMSLNSHYIESSWG